jgi:uncharacterized protein (TIGR02996 family)
MSALDRKLLDAVVAHPLDDGPRLVLSDALQERGDPRGLFITAQCRLQDRGLGPAERAAFTREAAALLKKHGAEWGARASGLSYTMRRGFVDEVEADATDLAKRSTLFTDEPVTRLTVTDASAADMDALAAVGVFARVARLTIRGEIGDDGASALAQALAKRTSPLHLLNVGDTAIGSSGAAALALALSGCHTLALTSNPVGDEGLEAIAGAKTLSSLRTLFLTNTDLTDAGVTGLAKSKFLGSLSRLGLARNEEVTAESLALIAASKKLKALRWLEYSDEDGMQSIATRRGGP